MVLMGKPEEKRTKMNQLVRLILLTSIGTHKETIWKTKAQMGDNIKIGLKVISWGVDWIDLLQDRNRCLAGVNTVINLVCSMKYGSILSQLRKDSVPWSLLVSYNSVA